MLFYTSIIDGLVNWPVDDGCYKGYDTEKHRHGNGGASLLILCILYVFELVFCGIFHLENIPRGVYNIDRS